MNATIRHMRRLQNEMQTMSDSVSVLFPGASVRIVGQNLHIIHTDPYAVIEHVNNHSGWLANDPQFGLVIACPIAYL